MIDANGNEVVMTFWAAFWVGFTSPQAWLGAAGALIGMAGVNLIRAIWRGRRD